MATKTQATLFEVHARRIAEAVFRARYNIPDDVFKDSVLSRIKTREQQVRDKYKLWSSPRLVRSVSRHLRDLECRSHIGAIDSLSAMRSKARTGNNQHKFKLERRKLLRYPLVLIIDELRKERSGQYIKKVDATLEFLSQGRVQGPDKVTIYTAPPNASSSDRGDRERAELRKRLSAGYSIKTWRNRHEIDEVFADLYNAAPWLSEPVRWLWERQLLNLEGRRKHVGFSPLLIVGPPGSGKTYLARLLGDLVGLKTARIDMSARSAAFDIVGVEYAWRSSHPGVPVRTISASDHANPLIVLDELDKSGTSSNGGDPVESLLPLLQPDMSRAFSCPYLQGPVDLSWVSWVGTANDLSRVPWPVRDRMKIFRIEAPRGAGLRKVVTARLEAVGAGLVAVNEICRRIEAGELSLRALGKLADEFEAISRRPILH